MRNRAPTGPAIAPPTARAVHDAEFLAKRDVRAARKMVRQACSNGPVVIEVNRNLPHDPAWTSKPRGKYV